MRLEIQCEDRIGMVREALDLFIPHGIDMRLVEVDTQRRCIYCGFSDIPFTKLQKLLADIRRLDSVEDVKTVTFTPSEREHNALYTLLEALPDGVISVDLKGQITMVTDLAAKDLNVPVEELLHKPIQPFIKGIYFPKDKWANPRSGMSKRIRINGKTLLMEMKPFFVKDDEGVANPAGTVIYLKSKTRLDRQTASLEQAPEAENDLEAYFLPSVIKSDVMKRTLQQAKAFAEVPMPLLVQGETGTGKRDLLQALFQYWQKRHGEQDCQITFCHGSDMTVRDVMALDDAAGWWVIEDVECLAKDTQRALAGWLAHQPGGSTSLDSTMRLVSMSSLSLTQLSQEERLDKSLYFALANLVLSVPPLRERKEDIEGLVQQTLSIQCERYRVPMPVLAKSALVKMTLYAWPGNLKELQNTCLQTLLSTQGETWEADSIQLPETHGLKELTLLNGSLDDTVKQWESELLTRLYPRYPSTRKLAKAVGMSHSAIANKLKEYGIK